MPTLDQMMMSPVFPFLYQSNRTARLPMIVTLFMSEAAQKIKVRPCASFEACMLQHRILAESNPGLDLELNFLHDLSHDANYAKDHSLTRAPARGS